MATTVETHFFKGNGRVPNSRLPLLVYRNAFDCRGSEMERRLRANDWMPTWHSPIGLFPQHHFHSQAHELIAIVRGEIRGLFGGHGGKEVTLKKGDTVVIPAGVGHYGISITDDLFVTGAFLSGSGFLDFRHGHPSEYNELCEVARGVPVPVTDPYFGAGGPLPTLWTAASAGSQVPEQVEV